MAAGAAWAVGLPDRLLHVGVGLAAWLVLPLVFSVAVATVVRHRRTTVVGMLLSACASLLFVGGGWLLLIAADVRVVALDDARVGLTAVVFTQTLVLVGTLRGLGRASRPGPHDVVREESP